MQTKWIGVATGTFLLLACVSKGDTVINNGGGGGSDAPGGSAGSKAGGGNAPGTGGDPGQGGAGSAGSAQGGSSAKGGTNGADAKCADNKSCTALTYACGACGTNTAQCGTAIDTDEHCGACNRVCATCSGVPGQKGCAPESVSSTTFPSKGMLVRSTPVISNGRLLYAFQDLDAPRRLGVGSMPLNSAGVGEPVVELTGNYDPQSNPPRCAALAGDESDAFFLRDNGLYRIRPAAEGKFSSYLVAKFPPASLAFCAIAATKTSVAWAIWVDAPTPVLHVVRVSRDALVQIEDSGSGGSGAEVPTFAPLYEAPAPGQSDISIALNNDGDLFVGGHKKNAILYINAQDNVAPSYLTPKSLDAFTVAADSTHVYYFDNDLGTGGRLLMRAAINTKTLEVVRAGGYFINSPNAIGEWLAIDDKYVYFRDLQGNPQGSTSQLARVPKEKTLEGVRPIEYLTSPANEVYAGTFLDPNGVYFFGYDGQRELFRVPK